MSYKRLIASCLLCKTEITTNQITNHYNSKSCKNPTNINIFGKGNCKHCGKNKTEISEDFANHVKWCKKIKVKQKICTCCGNIFETTSRRTRCSVKCRRTHTKETLSKIKSGMKRAIEENPSSYSGGYNRGRVKIIICSNGFKVLGKWEQKFIEFCVTNKIEVTQPNTGFSYNWNGNRTYFPDFYLPEYNLWIEIKGYQTERDEAKWDSLTNIHNKNLKIIKQNDLSNLDEFFNTLCDRWDSNPQ